MKEQDETSVSSDNTSDDGTTTSLDAADFEFERRMALLTQRKKYALVVLMVIFIGTAYLLLIPNKGDGGRWNHHNNNVKTRQRVGNPNRIAVFPLELQSVYDKNDFVNAQNISPPYWNKPPKIFNCSALTSRPIFCAQHTWGPCYPPPANEVYNWTDLVRYNNHTRRYHKLELRPESQKANPNPYLGGYCRPGFIIIGAGKCGTSSLYHYLVKHPRVLPASKKQIHYFKYYAQYNTRWYLAHFPTTASFLSSGALMTGEASPGYLPYPDVAYMASKRMPGPKIITIGRNPLERAYSSYKYNYVQPALTKLRLGKLRGIKGNLPKESYETYLFSFEDMVRAELDTLKLCLAPGGSAEMGAKKKWGHVYWAKQEMQRRQEAGLPPLLDLDGYCYGGKVNTHVPRAQWKTLVEKHPEKLINVRNMHLVQSFIGRSIYVLPLEWWYVTHNASNHYFVCTEELRDLTGEPLDALGQFLGLPSHNFSSIVNEGMYNVGYNTGYDKETTWEQVQNKTSNNNSHDDDKMPLSDELRHEVLEFLKPFNERLFKLIGKRCNW